MQRLSWAQFQLLGVGVEIILEIRNAQAVGMLIVDAQSATNIDVFNGDAMAF